MGGGGGCRKVRVGGEGKGCSKVREGGGGSNTLSPCNLISQMRRYEGQEVCQQIYCFSFFYTRGTTGVHCKNKCY